MDVSTSKRGLSPLFLPVWVWGRSLVPFPATGGIIFTVLTPSGTQGPQVCKFATYPSRFPLTFFLPTKPTNNFVSCPFALLSRGASMVSSLSQRPLRSLRQTSTTHKCAATPPPIQSRASIPVPATSRHRIASLGCRQAWRYQT